MLFSYASLGGGSEPKEFPMKTRLFAAAISLLTTLAGVAFAKDRPDPTIPTPEAKALMEQVQGAYAKLSGLRVAGQLDADIDVGGQADKKSMPFTGAYAATSGFRHEVKDQLITGSTGQKVYLYEIPNGRYLLTDAPKDRATFRQLPPVVGQLLEVQDPSLLMALSANSIADVVENGRLFHVTTTTDAGQSLPTLAYTSNDGREIQFAFDPETHLLRQATYDIGGVLKDRGAEKINRATITIHYSDTQANPALGKDSFAWAPPASAREIPQGSGDLMANLDGLPAPDFTLPTPDGKTVKLADLKGSVVLLDFWATWCPPCVRSLPEIAKIAQTRKDGVKVYAINLGEDKDTVAAFLKTRKIDVPVLLDEDENAGKSYGIRGIPTTIVIRPDGIVAKTFVGIPQGGIADIEHELDLAAKK